LETGAKGRIVPGMVNAKSSAANKEATARKRQRSAVTNGRKVFVMGNGASPWARRWRDLIEAHIADMGGLANLSAAQHSLIQRASTIECELEQIEGRLSLGRAQDLAEYATAASHLRRIFETLGITRKARDMGEVIDNGPAQIWSPLRSSLAQEMAKRAGLSE
jgi:hypothetical protein